MISSQIGSLDKIFSGGLQNGIITEISGLRGTGKTQLALQFAIDPLRNNKKILFIDTTVEFRPERFLQMLQSRNLHASLLENLHVSRVTDTHKQIEILKTLDKNYFSLLIIDNITYLFSFEYSKKEHLIENHKDHKITLVEEPHPYGTGGALINAKDHLGDETILIINADIFHDFDLSKLNRETECIHLVGVENPDHNTDGDFNIGPDGKVFCDDINKLTWSGISLLNAEILSKIDNNNFPFDSWSSIVLPQIKEEKVTGEIYSDIWLDVGTKDRLELANKILREEN